MAINSKVPTILIIDDNVANLKVAMAHLSAYSFEILTARDGQTGLERAQLAQPDLILLDLQMPGLDGFEVCRRLKANLQTQRIPVIFMTANSETDAVVRGFELGAVDYVVKPFASAELIARVQTHLTLYDLQQNLEEMVAAKTADLTQEIEERKKTQLEVERLLEIVRQQSEQLRRILESTLLTQELPTPDLRENPLFQLTNREYEVLQLIAQGKSTAEIADILTVSPSTISTYRGRIMTKLGLEDATALIKFAVENQLPD